jgi:hypothetical protein
MHIRDIDKLHRPQQIYSPHDSPKKIPSTNTPLQKNEGPNNKFHRHWIQYDQQRWKRIVVANMIPLPSDPTKKQGLASDVIMLGASTPATHIPWQTIPQQVICASTSKLEEKGGGGVTGDLQL